MKVFTFVIMIMMTLQISAKPKYAKSGNSNGFTMSAWYGGNNKHKCGLHKTKSRSRTKYLRY